MASPRQTTPPPGRFLATVLNDRHGYGGKDDCITVIRCNGSLFYVDLSPIFICNSPLLLARYLDFVSVVRDDYPWDDDVDDPNDPAHKHPEDILHDFHAWLIAALEPLFLRLVPDLPPSFDPAKLATGEAHPLLSEYLFPDEYYCRLEAEAETPIPIHLPDEPDRWIVTALNPIPASLAQELHQHVPFLDVSSIQVSFCQPTHALDREPTRVLAPLDPSAPQNLTPCFFKPFGVGAWDALEDALEAHLRVLKSPLPPSAHVVRLLGLVTAAEHGDPSDIAGILLTYIPGRRENGGVLSVSALQYTSPDLRARWAAQIAETVAQMHDAGVVWGDARAENVMIETTGDAWLIGLGGKGCTEGWVEERKRGTREGDLQGVGRILRHLAEEPYELDEELEWGLDASG